MDPVANFELVLLLLLAVILLELVARWLRVPPAAALILGGGALTFVPGMPEVSLNPELVLVLFLPPLLTASAYYTDVRDFRRNLPGIMQLAIGAVAFTTLVVGAAVHWAVPSLPWAACFALGAVVSPPDAVAAKAVLERVHLPHRTLALLEGESLLNDATGIVLYRFAVAAALTGAFSIGQAAGVFVVLAAGGVIVGAVFGFMSIRAVALFRRWRELEIGITTTLLTPWAAYICAERLRVSSVIAAVIVGLVVGWYQHEVFSARGRRYAMAVWQVLTYLLEALVFVLIGLSLRGVLARLGSTMDVMHEFGPPVLAAVATVIVSRFVWILAAERLTAVRDHLHGRDTRPRSFAAAVVMSWAGMRGVVTLAIALSVPAEMPGRDLILVAAFTVILVTVLLQGTTLQPLIRLLGIAGDERDGRFLDEYQARARVAAAQLAAVEPLARNADGSLRHPRLLEQYKYRVRVTERLLQDAASMAGERTAHFTVVLAAVAAGRAEVIRLHRAAQINDTMLQTLEYDLDLQELAAEQMRDRPDL